MQPKATLVHFHPQKRFLRKKTERWLGCQIYRWLGIGIPRRMCWLQPRVNMVGLRAGSVRWSCTRGRRWTTVNSDCRNRPFQSAPVIVRHSCTLCTHSCVQFTVVQLFICGGPGIPCPGEGFPRDRKMLILAPLWRIYYRPVNPRSVTTAPDRCFLAASHSCAIYV